MAIIFPDNDSVKEYRILSLSGGGVKGVAELVVLVEIEKITGQPISKLFNIIAGTSVGGLIAALLTIPKEKGSLEPKYSASEALEIFIKSAPEIFPDTTFGSIKQIITHKYSQEPLKKILGEYLEESRLSNTTSRLIIPVVDLESEGKVMKIFDSSDDYSPRIKVKDVLCATTAAPTFFKPVTNREDIKGYSNQEEVLYAFADGGIGANRPAQEVLKLLKKSHSRAEQAEILDKTIVTALNFKNDIETPSSIPKIGFDGILGWLIKGKLVDRLIQGSEDISTEDVRSDLPGEGEFVEISLPITKETMSLDNASAKNIENLLMIGKKYIEENYEHIQKLSTNLMYHLKKEQELKIQSECDESDNSDAGYVTLSDEEQLEGVDDVATDWSS